MDRFSQETYQRNLNKNKIMKNVNYKLKLWNSKDIRASFLKIIPQICESHNCSCVIDFKTKWYWFTDICSIDLSGEEVDIEKLTAIFDKYLKKF